MVVDAFPREGPDDKKVRAKNRGSPRGTPRYLDIGGDEDCSPRRSWQCAQQKRRSGSKGRDPAYFHRELPAGRYVAFIGRAEGQAVVCGGLAFYARPPHQGNDSGKEAYLMGMYTSASWRGKGLGRRVLRKILALAKARGVGRVWLHSEPGARTLYGRAGFRSNDSYMELTWRRGKSR